MVRVDVRDAISALNKEFGALGKDKRNLAVARAINHTIAKANTQVSREITTKYNIPAKYVKKALSVYKADRLTLTGIIKAKGKPLPLIAFRANQRKDGVSVITPDGRKLIPGVFIATMKSGHKGVFVRGKYSGGNIARRKHRTRQRGNDLGITEMVGVSIPKALSNKIIIKNLSRSINELFPDRLRHEMERLSLPA